MLRRLIVLAALAAAGWWYWTRWLPTHNYKALSGQLEHAIDQELSALGVTDAQVLQSVHKERSRLGLVWIESERRFAVDPALYPRLLHELASVAKAQHCSVMHREEMPHQAILEIGKTFCVMQRLVFVPPVKEEVTGKVAQVAFVIDDVAYEFEPMDRFAALNIPLTFAILPRDKNTKALALKAKQMKFGVILHLPMEPLDLVHNNPGGAALYLKMTPEELHQQFERDVASVPGIVGINNHMGSAFTENREKMDLVMQWVKEKHLFFLDSHTTGHSVVPQAAKQAGVPCHVNETFLDNADTVKDIEHQLDLVMRLALRHKRTIAIGHYRRKHLAEAFANKIPEFRSKGIQFVILPTFYPPHSR